MRPNGFPDDNSYFDGLSIVLGSGGVDDAEDADIIWHEYGHTIQFDQSRFAGGMLGEGFSDWWAAIMSMPVNGGYEEACVGDWNATSNRLTVPHCLRRIDSDLTMADQTGDVHHDGQIWSRALWDITQTLGQRPSGANRARGAVLLHAADPGGRRR